MTLILSQKICEDLELQSFFFTSFITKIDFVKTLEFAFHIYIFIGEKLDKMLTCIYINTSNILLVQATRANQCKNFFFKRKKY